MFRVRCATAALGGATGKGSSSIFTSLQAYSSTGGGLAAATKPRLGPFKATPPLPCNTVTSTSTEKDPRCGRCEKVVLTMTAVGVMYWYLTKTAEPVVEEDGRLILVCGTSGSGKTTVAEALKKEYGFSHFDGDCWQFGLDPVAQSGTTPTPEQIAARPADIGAAMDTFFAEYWMKLNAGEEGDFAACEQYYAKMLKDVTEYRNKNPKEDLVVSHMVLERRSRDLFREALGSKIQVIALDVPSTVLRRRKLARLERQAAEKDQTLEEFFKSFGAAGMPDNVEDCLKIFADPGKATQQAPQPDEVNIQMVQIQEGEDAASVFNNVKLCLGLAQK